MKESMEQVANKDHDIELQKQENWGKLIDKITPIIDYFTNKLLKHDAPLAKSTVWGFILIIGVILGTSFTLVMFNRLDSSGFTFIIGTILGYLLAAAKMFIKKENE